VPDWHAARDSSLAAKDERFIVSRGDIELTLGTCEDLSIFDSEERESTPVVVKNRRPPSTSGRRASLRFFSITTEVLYRGYGVPFTCSV